MDRRTTLLALAAAVPAALVTRLAKADGFPPVAPSTWLTETLQYGTLAKLTSLIALEKSSNSLVAAFAKGEVLEQSALAQALTGTSNPPPAKLTPDQENILIAVRDAPPEVFDGLYLSVQQNGHLSLLVLQDKLLANKYPLANKDAQQATVAKAFIENHLIALGLLIASKQ